MKLTIDREVIWQGMDEGRAKPKAENRKQKN